MTKEAAKKEIAKLIKDYELHRDEYKRKGYDEHQYCLHILNRFFTALGWDVNNDGNKSEFYCDTIFQFKLKHDKTIKFPDYAFGFPAKTSPKYFAEAKTPSTNLFTDKDPALQIRRYGKGAGLPISLVTNFEQLAFYDCTIRTKETDQPKVARLDHFTYDQYLDNFDTIWELFSKEGIEQGYHDKYLKSEAKKKGSVTLDKQFVATLDGWRKDLATSISCNNLKLSNEEINFVVQQTIDRIIFLRFCEDRNIEKFETLLATTKKGDLYKNLYNLFTEADLKYNSGLFDFEKDTISHKIKVDNKIIRNIIEELYRPKSDYEFGTMPVEILGNAYEEFLGKVIRITPGHIVKIDIDKKPEVKKAGGVFYTPQYIVNYIVEHTVGKLIHGKSPEQISKIKIVDPACGSGSFLLGAYIELLRYHTDYYWKKNYHKDRKKYHLLTPEGRLTVNEKKRILQNNLFGVDIDPNAVEVTKLSLLLKAMEGETEASVGQQLRLDKKGVLPDLDHNIQCGNSLISPDFYDEQLTFDKSEQRKINAFDWKAAFPQVFKQGGFDAVIGNPPYGALFTREESEYFSNKYKLQDYQLDSYFLFIERSFQILISKGLLGFIIPNTWLLNLKTSGIRKHLFIKTAIENIVHYHKPVFKQAVVDTEIMIFKNTKPSLKHQMLIEIIDKEDGRIIKKIKQQDWIKLDGDSVNIFDNSENQSIKNKVCKFPIMDAVCKITQGAKPFQVGKGNPAQTKKIVDEKPFVSDKKKNKLFKPLLRGSLMNRYQINWSNDYWIKFGDWLAEPRYSADYFAKEKIVIRQTGDHLNATLDTKQFVVRDNLYTILPREKELNLRYILGLLNSKFMNWYYQNIINNEKGEALAQVKRGHIAQLPIKKHNPKNHSEKIKHDSIIRQVDNLLQLNKELKKAKLPNDIRHIENRIYSSENKLNEIIYELYGINKKEIDLIEQNL